MSAHNSLTSVKQIVSRAEHMTREPRTTIEVTTPFIWNIPMYQRLFEQAFILLNQSYSYKRWGTIELSNGSRVVFLTDLGTGTRRFTC